jgi:hypothetical protein
MFAVVVLVAVTAVITGVVGVVAAVIEVCPALLVPAKLVVNPLTRYVVPGVAPNNLSVLAEPPLTCVVLEVIVTGIVDALIECTFKNGEPDCVTVTEITPGAILAAVTVGTLGTG